MEEAATTLEAVDIMGILETLPHRYPFLMIDRIVGIRGDECAIGIKNVTFNEPQFLGHFPKGPVFPGVLMIEGMAQTAGVICLRAIGAVGKPIVGLFSNHRQSEVSQAGGAGRYPRISHDQEEPEEEHVVVSRRSQGRGTRRWPRPRSAPCSS